MKHLEHTLLQGELADLHLYQALRKRATGTLANMLDEFIIVEKRHADFWRKEFALTETTPDLRGRIRNVLVLCAARLLGDRATFLLLESIETHGIKKYLSFWKRAKDTPVSTGLRRILSEELVHEDEAATRGGTRQIDPDTIRNAFLGFNDGSVEILGAVSGLHAALTHPTLVIISAVTISVAGSLSMAAGAFLATHSEAELREMEAEKQAFLHTDPQMTVAQPAPWRAARIVGTAYLVGAVIPVFPFLLGAQSIWFSIILSGTLILLVSSLLAFLSGMDIRRRMLLNTGIVIAAVSVSYLTGTIIERILGT